MIKMSTNLIVCIIIALSLLICPTAALLGDEPSQHTSEALQTLVAHDDDGTITVMNHSTGISEKMEMREYLIGCVAAEMPAEYHSQALKAQAVACHTYALYTVENNTDGIADITDNPDEHQGYVNQSKRREKWGDNYDAYEQKISAAVDEVLGYYMTCDGETALAVYHSISGGTTCSAKGLWGSDISCLVSVESAGDRLSPDYITETVYSDKEFISLAKECGVSFDNGEKVSVDEVIKEESGYVTAVIINGDEISVTDFRKAFSLRSGCFDIEYDEEFVITCRGYGHGVGMSQYGADYMARQGSTWREILSHYYTGIEIEKKQ